MEPLLKIENLVKHFHVGESFFGRGKKKVHALNGVSLQVARGESLGVVGESGCGKSTLALTVLRLLKPDGGKIFLEGRDITKLSQKNLRPLRAKMQMVFQDPYASLNPRMRIGKIIEEPLTIHKIGKRSTRHEEVERLLERVGLGADDYDKYAHEFSGGQRQRIGIARAIALRPALILADEPVSALDVSIQGEIINLLKDLQKEFGLTLLFISHDLKIVSQMCDRIAVMYLGKIVEELSTEKITEAKHPYTQALLEAVPIPDPRRRQEHKLLEGDVPTPMKLPDGCFFHPRCRYKEDRCLAETPQLEQKSPGQTAACHFTDKIPAVKI